MTHFEMSSRVIERGHLMEALEPLMKRLGIPEQLAVCTLHVDGDAVTVKLATADHEHASWSADLTIPVVGTVSA